MLSQNYSSKQNYKEFWKNINLIPSKKEDKQLPWLIDTLKRELDINKIETVLEVGVGYGRVAKAILDTFPNIDYYFGIDISNDAIEQSRDYVGYTHLYDGEPTESFHSHTCDFEDSAFGEIYDLVISVETMSTIPENISVQPWIDKMISLSKKYVVNLDYVNTTHPIFNNAHDYRKHYTHAGELHYWKDVPNNPDMKLFLCRVK